MSERSEVAWVVISFIVGFVLILATIGLITNHIEFAEASAEIAQLREDSSDIASNSEDVVGQITQYNQEIKRMQARNDIPIIGLVIPNGWDDVELIKLPDSTK